MFCKLFGLVSVFLNLLKCENSLGSCSNGDWECGDNQCIPSHKRCDAIFDCQNHNDEDYCPICPNNSTRCSHSRKCFHASYRCNGVDDCNDGTAMDENACPAEKNGKCKPDFWQCSSGQCIPNFLMCNGYNNCIDDSDELNCSFCQNGLVPCSNGRCIPFIKLCDSVQDCVDNSDENNCTKCQDGYWRCNTSGCISDRLRCNGYPDCTDRSDEYNCTECRPSKTRCLSGLCLSENLKCNGIDDCGDYSDEENCTVCTPGVGRCGDGRCLAHASRCNGHSDCLDNSDEANCTKLITDDQSEDTTIVQVTVIVCFIIAAIAGTVLFIAFRSGRVCLKDEKKQKQCDVEELESDHYDIIYIDTDHEAIPDGSSGIYNPNEDDDHQLYEDLLDCNDVRDVDQCELDNSKQGINSETGRGLSWNHYDLPKDDAMYHTNRVICLNGTDYIAAVDVDYSAQGNVLNGTQYISAVDVDYSAQGNVLNGTQYISAVDVDYSALEHVLNSTEYISAVDVDYNTEGSIISSTEYIPLSDVDYYIHDDVLHHNTECIMPVKTNYSTQKDELYNNDKYILLFDADISQDSGIMSPHSQISDLDFPEDQKEKVLDKSQIAHQDVAAGLSFDGVDYYSIVC